MDSDDEIIEREVLESDSDEEERAPLDKSEPAPTSREVGPSTSVIPIALFVASGYSNSVGRLHLLHQRGGELP